MFEEIRDVLEPEPGDIPLEELVQTLPQVSSFSQLPPRQSRLIRFLLLAIFCAWPISSAAIAFRAYILIVAGSQLVGEDSLVYEDVVIKKSTLLLGQVAASFCITTPICFFAMGFLGLLLLLRRN